MKFLCLAYEQQSDFDALSTEEWAKIREETLAYVDSLRQRGKLIDTRPLRSSRKASSVRVRDGALSITDGPFAETKEQLGGYFLIDVADRDEALQIASEWPSARIGTIEVRPVDEGLNPERRYD